MVLGVQSEQFIGGPAKQLGLLTKAVEEQPGIIDELMPALSWHISRRVSLDGSEGSGIEFQCTGPFRVKQVGLLKRGWEASCFCRLR
jgi:hypothetical protein